METSAKSGFNTTELFVEAAKMLYKDYLNYRKKTKAETHKLKVDNEANMVAKKKCC